MKKFISKIVAMSMLAAMVIIPKTAFAAVTMDDTLTELGFVSYAAGGYNSSASVVDTGESGHDEALMFKSTGNTTRTGCYGGVKYPLNLGAGTYVISADYKITDVGDITGKRYLYLWNTNHSSKGGGGKNVSAAHDWTNMKYEVTLSSSNTYYAQFAVDGNVTAYIDNIKVYNKADTNKTNLLPTSDFTPKKIITESGPEYFPFWTISSNEAATVERVYDEQANNHYAKLTNLGTGTTYNKLYYQIPESKINKTHSYTVSAKVRTANYTDSNNWLALSWGGQDSTPWIEQNGMQKDWITVSHTRDGGFTGKLGFGFTKSHACELYIDDLKVYDNTAECYVKLENPDFEKVASDYVLTADTENMPGWDVTAGTTAKVEKVYDFTSGSWYAKITNVEAVKTPYKINYRVPKTRLTEGHTYRVNLDLHTENRTGGGYVYFGGGGVKLSNTYIPNYKNGGNMQLSGADLYNSNVITFGLDIAAEDSCTIDNLVITDEATGENIPLENADFEKTAEDYREEITGDYYGWYSPFGENFEASCGCYVSRELDIATDSWCMVIRSLCGATHWNALIKNVPEYDAEKLYNVEMDVRTVYPGESGHLHITAGDTDNGGVKYSNSSVKNNVNGNHVLLENVSFAGNRQIRFGFSKEYPTVLYIDNVIVYASDDETKTDILYAGDFETSGSSGIFEIDVDDNGVEYLKLEGEINYNGGATENTGIGFDGLTSPNNILTIQGGKSIVLGYSTVSYDATAGKYSFKVIYDFNDGIANIRVTTPTGEIIERSHPNYLSDATSIKKLVISTTSEDYLASEVIENLKINEVALSDLPSELTAADVKLYKNNSAISNYNRVPANIDKIKIDINTPLFDKSVLDNMLVIKNVDTNENVQVASTEYADGIYTINLNNALDVKSDYTVTFGTIPSFVFTTDIKARAEITGITKGETEIIKLAQLSEGDTVTVSVDYASVDNSETNYTVYAASYDVNGKLLSIETVKDEDDTNTGSYNLEIGSLIDVSETVFYIWDIANGMSPLADAYIVPMNIIADSDVYSLVTTFNGDAGEARGFAWTATSGYTDMVIQYAKADELWTNSKLSKQARYTAYDGKLYYKTEIDGLEPGETYTYRVGDTADDVWSKFYTFETEPENTDSFSFIGMSDTHIGITGSTELTKLAFTEGMNYRPDASFIVHLGDITDGGIYGGQWSAFFSAAGEYAKRLPIMAAIGNHATRGNETTAGKYFSLHFNNPDNGANALGDLTVDDVANDYSKGVINNIEDTIYSFDYGNTHFAVLNGGSDWSLTSDGKILLSKQAEWLRADMNASDKKWKILMIHMGPYPVKLRGDSRAALEDTIDECGIDLVLQGHDHMVARTYPMNNNEVVTKQNIDSVVKGTGTVYAILGAGGAKRYEMLASTTAYTSVINVTSSDQPSYTVFDVSDEKIEVITKQINGAVIDKFEITDNAQ